MIQLPNVTIPQETLDKLKEYQDQIDVLPTFEGKKCQGKIVI